jgi:hypothetical protein
MNNLTLDQKAGVDTIAVVNTATKVQRKPHTAIADVSIMERLTTALSFKISHTIPKYPYFIGDIPPIYPRNS